MLRVITIERRFSKNATAVLRDLQSTKKSKLAYYDTLYNGLVPCKVTGIRVYNEFGQYEVYFTITATRGAYKRGESLVSSPLHVIPRENVRVRRGHYGIKSGYSWEWLNK